MFTGPFISPALTPMVLHNGGGSGGGELTPATMTSPDAQPTEGSTITVTKGTSGGVPVDGVLTLDGVDVTGDATDTGPALVYVVPAGGSAERMLVWTPESGAAVSLTVYPAIGPTPPENVAPPSISWSGNDWTVTPGTWTGADNVNTVVTLDGVAVGLTGTITAGDDGDTLLVTETATNGDGSTVETVSEVVSYTAPAHPLASYAGISAGEMPIILDMLWPGSYTTGTDGSDTVVMSADNLGGTGAYHGLTADGASTAPRLDNDAMLFRFGDLIRMANEAGLDGVHAIMEVYLVYGPNNNEEQSILGHDGSASAGLQGHIQYIRSSSQHRFRLYNAGSSQSAYKNFGAALINQWRVMEMRYDAATGAVAVAMDGANFSYLTLPGGGDLYVNMLGNTMRDQHIGALISVVTDSGNSMASPEAAVTAARSYLIGRRA